MYSLVFCSPAFRLTRWSCAGHGRSLGAPEPVPAHEIVIPTGGVFVRASHGREEVGSPMAALFGAPGDAHRFRHPVDGGDRGIAIQLSEVALEDVARASGMVAKGDPRLPARAGRITPRLTLAVHALLREAADAPDPARVEELVGELAREAVTSARGAAVPGAPRDARRRYEKAVNSALELIAHRFRSRLSLAEIAAAAAYSPFHFSAVFRRVTGHSVHQYVLRLRLREAASRIAQGERNLSALAHELGFSSHSHFTLSFRREYGITPSGFRGRGAHA